MLQKTLLTIIVGRAILPAAAVQAALSGQARIFAFGQRRLKAGGSQDWLPHVCIAAGFRRRLLNEGTT